MSDAELLDIEAEACEVPPCDPSAEMATHVLTLVTELRRLRRGDFTPDEFQALCHHLDDKSGCTRDAFEAGCRAYQDKLFGPDELKTLLAEVKRLKGERDAACDVRSAMKALEDRIITNTPHPSHIWVSGAFDCCIRCELARRSPKVVLPCDVSKTAGKVEFCCECAGEYPRSDLIAGHIFCKKCRKLETPNANGAPA